MPEYRRKGYAKQAAFIFIDFAFRNQLPDSLISILVTLIIDPKRVAPKNGLKRIS